jgi:hypothetical protein
VQKAKPEDIAEFGDDTRLDDLLTSPRTATATIRALTQPKTQIIELLREVHLLAITEMERLNRGIVELENQNREPSARSRHDYGLMYRTYDSKGGVPSEEMIRLALQKHT